MSTKYENYITGDDGAWDSYGAIWITQTFTPSTNHTVNAVRLKLYRLGSPGTVTVSIKATSSGKPTGADLASGTFDGNSLPTSAATAIWKWIRLGSGTALTASTVYAIVVRATGGNSINKIDWRYDGSGSYADGRVYASDDSGSTWTYIEANNAPRDFMFEEWDFTLLPSDPITRVTNLIHRYVRKEGVYTLELALGEVTSDFGLPQWLSRPQASTPEKVAQQQQEDVAKSPIIRKSIQESIDYILANPTLPPPGTFGPPLVKLAEVEPVSPEPAPVDTAKVTEEKPFIVPEGITTLELLRRLARKTPRTIYR